MQAFATNVINLRNNRIKGSSMKCESFPAKLCASYGTIVMVVCLFPLLASAENWPVWRGPNFNGVVENGDFPTKWSNETNVAWKVAMPGRSGATPAVWEDHVFVTTDAKGENGVLCLNRMGKQLWKATVGDLVPGKHRKASGSNPSPTTDGKHVYVYFKSGDLACLDFEGKVVWQKNLQSVYGENTLWWDLGTSPVLTDTGVVVAVMQSGDSYIVTFDKETGKEIWKQDRNLGAPEEAAQSYSTPIVVEHEGRQQLILVGADHITSNDAATGKEIWRVGGLNPTGHKYFRSIASPAVAEGIVAAPYARGGSLTGVKLGGSGDVTKSHVAWQRESESEKQKLSADVPTPVAKDGRVYLCTDKGIVHCFDLKTGKTIWSHELEKNRSAYSSSPILVGDSLYLTREDGKTFVLSVKGEPKVIAENELKESIVATPVFIDGKILFRTFDHLYCIE